MPIDRSKIESATSLIPNLRIVSDSLIRGGQPEPRGLDVLKNGGVRTIVNLCGSSSGLVSLFRGGGAAACETEELRNERATAEKLGLNFVSIPLDVFRRPGEESLQKFVDVIHDADNGPIFLHCLHGRDRTGLMTAIYRVSCDGWQPDKAYAEMLECGFDATFTHLSDAMFAFSKRASSNR